MGQKTKIDWCDATWNPVTGCLHGCEYCYARKIARRFGKSDDEVQATHVVRYRRKNWRFKFDGNRFMPVGNPVPAPYPYGFDPTMYYYKLEEPQHWVKPRTIFVCSMADLFGEWVPYEWIRDVFKACEEAPQHRYMFLTKNPSRYIELYYAGLVLPNYIDWWYGYTVDGLKGFPEHAPIKQRTFVSVEPIQCELDSETIENITKTSWVIIGAETGRRKGKVIPQKAWIDTIVAECDKAGIPVFMKNSLREIMSDNFRQAFPWEVQIENEQ